MDAGDGLSTCGQSWRDCPRADNPARFVLLLTIAGRRSAQPVTTQRVFVSERNCRYGLFGRLGKLLIAFLKRLDRTYE